MPNQLTFEKKLLLLGGVEKLEIGQILTHLGEKNETCFKLLLYCTYY